MRHYLLVGIFFKVDDNENRFHVLMLPKLTNGGKLHAYKVKEDKQTLILNYL